ncbi:MAG: hypothetical protein QG604_274 [Candidatus Dependentiae bacterium]|nr:hypothetical protein [Candidatus Dependentiae bacterium]
MSDFYFTSMLLSFDIDDARRKKMQRRLILAAFWSACVLSLPGILRTEGYLFQEAIDNATESSALFLSTYDVEVKLSGNVRQEAFSFFSPLLFRSDYFDRYAFERARFNFDIDSSFGKQRYGESAVDARFRITTFKVFDNNKAYTPPVLETVSFNAGNYIKKADIGDHVHDLTVVLAYLEEGFVDIKLEKFLPMLVPTHLKIGYFPYLIGRGVALGDYAGGAVDYLGWYEDGNIGNTTHVVPGLTLTLGDRESFAAEFYYSNWKKESQGPDHTRKEVRARRLDRDEVLSDIRSVERGVNADRTLFAVRGIINHKSIDNGYSSYIEPYLVYVHAPELKVEFDGDASASLGTVGCMVDWSYNGWNINTEVGVQFGHQTMHPIDRNHIIYDDAYYVQTATLFDGASPTASATIGRLDATYGPSAKYHSHVLLGMTQEAASDPDYLDSGFYLPYRAYYVSDELDHVNANRTAAEQGALIRTGAPVHSTDDFNAGQIYQSKKASADDLTPNSSLYSPYMFVSGVSYYDDIETTASIRPHGTFFNANIPFGSGTRFRDKYTLDFAGVMAMIDVSYTFPSKKGTMAAAVGYISGADYPFNREEDQRYSGFVPLRDANYKGQIVKSYAVLAARKIARPSTFSENLLYAPNNYEDSSNIQYFGFAAAFRPCDNRDELLIESNLMCFWEVIPPFKWDKAATRDFGDDKLNGIWSKLQTDFHFTGYQTTQRASKHLGVEFNTVVTWRPASSIEVRALFATFIPGKLYQDIDGTPNAYGVRVDADGDVHLDSLGRKVPFGGTLRLTYFF